MKEGAVLREKSSTYGGRLQFMRASTILEEGAPILVGRHIIYEGAIPF